MDSLPAMLIDENKALKARIAKLEAVLTDVVSTLDAYLAFTSDDPRHVALRMVVHGSKRAATAALEAK